MEPWENFYRCWLTVAEPGEDVSSARAGAERRVERLAAATSQAARAAEEELRGKLDWSLVNTRMLVGRFVAAADEWAALGSTPEQLRGWLREVWREEQRLCRVEEQRRTATEAVLAGGVSRRTTESWQELEDSFAYELHAW